MYVRTPLEFASRQRSASSRARDGSGPLSPNPHVKPARSPFRHDCPAPPLKPLGEACSGPTPRVGSLPLLNLVSRPHSAYGQSDFWLWEVWIRAGQLINTLPRDAQDLSDLSRSKKVMGHA
jgi:hypothetical protein